MIIYHWFDIVATDGLKCIHHIILSMILGFFAQVSNHFHKLWVIKHHTDHTWAAPQWWCVTPPAPHLIFSFPLLCANINFLRFSVFDRICLKQINIPGRQTFIKNAVAVQKEHEESLTLISFLFEIPKLLPLCMCVSAAKVWSCQRNSNKSFTFSCSAKAISRGQEPLFKWNNSSSLFQHVCSRVNIRLCLARLLCMFGRKEMGQSWQQFQSFVHRWETTVQHRLPPSCLTAYVVWAPCNCTLFHYCSILLWL